MTNYYTRNAEKLCAAYDDVAPDEVYSSYLEDILSKAGGHALDIGSGSGRDAAWLSSLGYLVTATEPNDEMRERASSKYGPEISWANSALPDLSGIERPVNGFDLIMCGGVLMHVRPENRKESLETISRMLSANGIAIINFRTVTSSDFDREMFDISLDEIENIAQETGLKLETNRTEDTIGRDILWYACKLRNNKHELITRYISN